MVTIPSYVVKIGETIWLRATIFLYFYLSLIFARMFVSAGAHDHPYLVVICAFFYEAMSIIIFNLLYGKYSVGRDINLLSTLGLISIPIYFFLSFVGIDASQQQNLFAKGLNVLIVLRCVYLTERDLFAKFSPIEITKKWLLKRQWFVNSYINGLTVAVFILCAAPLFTMMYVLNTDEMRASGIAVVLFAFFVAFENARRYSAEDTIAPEVVPDFMEGSDFDQAEHAMAISRVIYFALALLVGLLSFIIADNKEKFFNVGYASGYSDAKAGVKPKREADFDKALWCNMVRNPGQPLPPGMTCDDYRPKK